MPPDPQKLRLIARRLSVVATGSRLADEAIHAALGRSGYPPPYSSDEGAVTALLPPWHEVFSMNISARRWYAMCWCGDELADRYTGWASEPRLARLAAVLQAIGGVRAWY